MTFITDTLLPGVGTWLSFTAFVSFLSFFVALLTWKLVLHSKPLRLGGSVLIFVVSASSSCGAYGHIAGPVAFLVFWSPSYWETWAREALVAGVAVTCLFAWWSRRRMHRPSAPPSN
jgi:hypothetical protein